MSGALVAAVISMCATGIACENKAVRIERRACGAHYRAEVYIGGQWVAGQARVACSK